MLKHCERDGQPGERRHRAQHLKDRVEPAMRRQALADKHAKGDADNARGAVADGDARQGCQDMQPQTLVDAAMIEERIEDEIL